MDNPAPESAPGSESVPGSESAPAAAAPNSPRRRRRLPWLVGLGGVLVGGLIGGLVAAGALRSGHEEADLALAAETDLVSQAFPDAGDGDGPAGHHGPLRRHRWPLGPDAHVIVGSVAGVGANDLTVATDGGSPTTIPTGKGTRVAGAGNHALSDLNNGERVVVRVGSDGTALAVGVVQAHVAGTVTALDGDRATVRRPDGLAVPVDLSGVPERPAVGTIVAIRGSADPTGGVLHAEDVTQAP